MWPHMDALEYAIPFIQRTNRNLENLPFLQWVGSNPSPSPEGLCTFSFKVACWEQNAKKWLWLIPTIGGYNFAFLTCPVRYKTHKRPPHRISLLKDMILQSICNVTGTLLVLFFRKQNKRKLNTKHPGSFFRTKCELALHLSYGCLKQEREWVDNF